MRKIRGRKLARPKTKLGLPDLEQAKTACLPAYDLQSRNVAIDTRLMNCPLVLLGASALLQQNCPHALQNPSRRASIGSWHGQRQAGRSAQISLRAADTGL